MGDPLKKVLPGQELSIPAEAYNAFIDAGIAVRRNRKLFEQTHESDVRQATIIKVRNLTGNGLPRFSVLGIDSPVILPSAHLQNFQNQVAFNVVTPDVHRHFGRFVILFDPLPAGAIGRAVVAGVSVVRLNVTNENYSCADVAHSDTATLQVAATGSAQVLWREAGLGSKWAVVRFGNTCLGTPLPSSSSAPSSLPSSSQPSIPSSSTPPSSVSSPPSSLPSSGSSGSSTPPSSGSSLPSSPSSQPSSLPSSLSSVSSQPSPPSSSSLSGSPSSWSSCPEDAVCIYEWTDVSGIGEQWEWVLIDESQCLHPGCLPCPKPYGDFPPGTYPGELYYYSCYLAP